MQRTRDQRSRSSRPITIHGLAQSGDVVAFKKLLNDNPFLLNERNPVVRSLSCSLWLYVLVLMFCLYVCKSLLALAFFIKGVVFMHWIIKMGSFVVICLSFGGQSEWSSFCTYPVYVLKDHEMFIKIWFWIWLLNRMLILGRVEEPIDFKSWICM